LADAVHTVSPSYKDDVLRPSTPPEFIGGEGVWNWTCRRPNNQGGFLEYLMVPIIRTLGLPKKELLYRNTRKGLI